MKQAAKYGFIILALASLVGCKEPSEDVNVNIINYNATYFTLNKGYKHLHSVNPANGINCYRVFLMDKNVSFDGSMDKFKGEGSLIKFSVYSLNDLDIKQGAYTIDAFQSHDTLTAGDCMVYTNYSFEKDSGNVYNVTGGLLEFTNLGASLKIHINMVANDTVHFKGNFFGVLGKAEF